MPKKRKYISKQEYMFLLSKGEENKLIQVETHLSIDETRDVIKDDHRYRGYKIVYETDLMDVPYHCIEFSLGDM